MSRIHLTDPQGVPHVAESEVEAMQLQVVGYTRGGAGQVPDRGSQPPQAPTGGPTSADEGPAEKSRTRKS